MNSTAMNHPSALLSYANAAADNGNGEQAKTMLRQILAEHPNSTEASIARATLRTLATAAVRVVDVDITFWPDDFAGLQGIRRHDRCVDRPSHSRHGIRVCVRRPFFEDDHHDQQERSRRFVLQTTAHESRAPRVTNDRRFRDRAFRHFSVGSAARDRSAPRAALHALLAPKPPRRPQGSFARRPNG